MGGVTRVRLETGIASCPCELLHCPLWVMLWIAVKVGTTLSGMMCGSALYWPLGIVVRNA